MSAKKLYRFFSMPAFADYCMGKYTRNAFISHDGNSIAKMVSIFNNTFSKAFLHKGACSLTSRAYKYWATLRLRMKTFAC